MARARNARRPPRQPCIGHRRRGPTCARRYLPALIQTASLVSKRGRAAVLQGFGWRKPCRRAGTPRGFVVDPTTPRRATRFSPTAPRAPLAQWLTPLRCAGDDPRHATRCVGALRIGTSVSEAAGRARRAGVDATCVAGGAAVSAAFGRRSRPLARILPLVGCAPQEDVCRHPSVETCPARRPFLRWLFTPARTRRQRDRAGR